MPQPARSPELDEAFAEANLEGGRALDAGGPSEPSRPARRRGHSDIQDLIVPGDERASASDVAPREELPGSIEEAVLSALDRIPRLPTLPPPPADAGSGSDDGSADAG